MKHITLPDFTGEKYNMGERFHKYILKKRMDKMDKWKPGIIASMREEVENKCQKEYNDTIEELQDDIYELRHTNNQLSKDKNTYKAKFEEYKELYDKLFEKHLEKTEIVGETKEKLNTTEEALKEALDKDTPLDENTDFNKELKMLVARCNNEKYNKSESMSSFSAKWNVSLKEVLDEEEKIIDFKWKEIHND